MKTIYKYEIEFNGGAIEMPTGAIVIHAAVQGEDFFIWVEVDTDNPKEDRRFEVFCTGEPMPTVETSRVYISTAFRGAFVFHVYERL